MKPTSGTVTLSPVYGHTGTVTLSPVFGHTGTVTLSPVYGHTGTVTLSPVYGHTGTVTLSPVYGHTGTVTSVKLSAVSARSGYGLARNIGVIRIFHSETSDLYVVRLVLKARPYERLTFTLNRILCLNHLNHCTVLYRTAPHRTAPHRTAPHRTVLYSLCL